MVDVSEKAETLREAVARGEVRLQPATLRLVAAGAMPKGDVLAVARLAGIMAAKRTAELIPLCHPIGLDAIRVEAALDPGLPGVRVHATARLRARTGVEMEALTAVAVACLTVYDMVKAVDRGMTIEQVRLTEKSGGASGHWSRQPDRRQDEETRER
jgi:cyclic pyranopterin phosphate synthase